jgi:HK97 gp10 family phage protein
MARTRSRVLGVAALRRKVAALDPEIRSKLAGGVRDAGAEILEDMKANVPVSAQPPAGRGHLRDALAMNFRPDILSAKVGLLTKRQQRVFYYFRFIEWGTRYVPARPFIGPALLRAEGGWLNRMKAAALNGVRTVNQMLVGSAKEE